MRISDWSSDVCSSDLEELVLLVDLLVEIIAPDQEIDRAVEIGSEAHFLGEGVDRDVVALATDQVGSGEVRILVGEGAHLAIGRDRGQRHIAQIIVDLRRSAVILDPVLRQEIIRSEEHTSELQSLMRFSYAFFCFSYNTFYF